ncbi:TetR/AcrR family transcriptional regulator [Acinetobacter baumannii]|nr:TetR/AcrR family transcriptional regulator [Acinetobacter baumannii]MDO7400092.1 TetR/AcrR family transcriptional regulator [Acinetobacter baumannii]
MKFPSSSSRIEKHNKRRQLIIDTALKLTIEHGLDQVSISDIARESKLGPGQIYRCFRDKEEIIENIILNITTKRISGLGFNKHNNEIKAEELASGYPNNIDPDELNLLYEVLNVSRNEKINEVLATSEKKMQKQAQIILDEYYKNASKEEIRAISEVVATLTEGVIFRKAKGFSDDVDPDILEKIYKAMLQSIDSLFCHADIHIEK